MWASPRHENDRTTKVRPASRTTSPTPAAGEETTVGRDPRSARSSSSERATGRPITTAVSSAAAISSPRGRRRVRAPPVQARHLKPTGVRTRHRGQIGSAQVAQAMEVTLPWRSQVVTSATATPCRSGARCDDCIPRFARGEDDCETFSPFGPPAGPAPWGSLSGPRAHPACRSEPAMAHGPQTALDLLPAGRLSAGGPSGRPHSRSGSTGSRERRGVALGVSPDMASPKAPACGESVAPGMAASLTLLNPPRGTGNS